MSEFLSPEEVAEKVVKISKKKCELKILPMILLGMLVCVYISLA